MRVDDKIQLNIPNEFRGHVNGTHVRWKDHVGDKWSITYQGVETPIQVDTVDAGHVTFSHTDRSVTITITSMSNKLKFQKEHGWCEGGKLLHLVDESVVLSPTGHNASVRYKYSLHAHIQSDVVDYELLNRWYKLDRSGAVRKYYQISCNLCGWVGDIPEDSIDKHAPCPCCLNRVVAPGINDIATTDAWAIPYFQHPEDTTKYHRGTIFKVDMICPLCKQHYPNVIIDRFFTNVNNLNCPCSSAGRSYPEKFVHNLLTQLEVNSISQYSNVHSNWCRGYRYDFYLPDYNCMIETHGIQHYDEDSCIAFGITLAEEQRNDALKQFTATANGIDHYIVLDCRVSTMSWVSKSIIDSELLTLLNVDAQSVDWVECDKLSRPNIWIEICKYYDANISATVPAIAQIFGVSTSTVKSHLKYSAAYGQSTYDSYSIRERLANPIRKTVLHAVYYQQHLIKICMSKLAAAEHCRRVFNICVTAERVTYCEQSADSYQGLQFVKLSQVTSYESYVDFMLDFYNHYIT